MKLTTTILRDKGWIDQYGQGITYWQKGSILILEYDSGYVLDGLDEEHGFNTVARLEALEYALGLSERLLTYAEGYRTAMQECKKAWGDGYISHEWIREEIKETHLLTTSSDLPKGWPELEAKLDDDFITHDWLVANGYELIDSVAYHKDSHSLHYSHLEGEVYLLTTPLGTTHIQTISELKKGLSFETNVGNYALGDSRPISFDLLENICRHNAKWAIFKDGAVVKETYKAGTYNYTTKTYKAKGLTTMAELNKAIAESKLKEAQALSEMLEDNSVLTNDFNYLLNLTNDSDEQSSDKLPCPAYECLMFNGEHVELHMLHKGIYTCAKPSLYLAGTGRDALAKSLDILFRSGGDAFNVATENIAKCEWVALKLTSAYKANGAYYVLELMERANIAARAGSFQLIVEMLELFKNEVKLQNEAIASAGLTAEQLSQRLKFSSLGDEKKTC